MPARLPFLVLAFLSCTPKSAQSPAPRPGDPPLPAAKPVAGITMQVTNICSRELHYILGPANGPRRRSGGSEAKASADTFAGPQFTRHAIAGNTTRTIIVPRGHEIYESAGPSVLPREGAVLWLGCYGWDMSDDASGRPPRASPDASPDAGTDAGTDAKQPVPSTNP